MAGQFVQTREPLCATRERARMRFFARMCPKMSDLMFQPVEGFITHSAFERAVLFGFFLGSGTHGEMEKVH